MNYCRSSINSTGKLSISLGSANSSTFGKFTITINNVEKSLSNQFIFKNLDKLYSRVYQNFDNDVICAEAYVNQNDSLTNKITNFKVDGKYVSGNFSCTYKIAPNTSNNCNGALPDSIVITEGYFETEIFR